jgi:hypothetical protein
MLHQIITMDPATSIDDDVAATSGDCPLRKELALLAAGLDTRFLRAGTTLANAVGMIDRVIGGLDGVVAALDERTAGAAVTDLRGVADALAALPARQAGRRDRMGAVAAIARDLNDHVLDMHQTLRVLNIYGVNIKIAASGADQFVDFVEGMATKLSVGEHELAGFIVQLKELMLAVADVQQADRLLAAESATVVPEIPARLASDAGALAKHLADVAVVARTVADIARRVQGKVAVVLGALQVGDSTRQRLEHVVATLQLLEASGGDVPPDPVVVGHIDRLLAAQIEGARADFARDTATMLASLADLLPETDQLLALIADQGDGGSRDFLERLERGIADVERVTGRLRDAERRSTAMATIITETIAGLTRRLAKVQLIRLQVQDIATNTRLLCRRQGAIGKAVSVIAVEVDAYARRLGESTECVAQVIADLKAVEAALLDAVSGTAGAGAAGGGRDMGDTLAGALAVIRDACQRTGLVSMEGSDDARHLGALLMSTVGELANEEAVAAAMGQVAERLARRTPPLPMTDDAEAALRQLLPRIAAMYTMAQERTIHAQCLPPGIEAEAPIEDEDEDDDGLF